MACLVPKRVASYNQAYAAFYGRKGAVSHEEYRKKALEQFGIS
jgi:hypothetical protein